MVFPGKKNHLIIQGISYLKTRSLKGNIRETSLDADLHLTIRSISIRMFSLIEPPEQRIAKKKGSIDSRIGSGSVVFNTYIQKDYRQICAKES